MDNSFRTDFLDVIWYKDSNGNKISKEITNENHIITNGLIVLDGIPDKFYKVEISGMYETDIKNSLTSAEFFKVDYDHAKVYFHSSLEGQTINITRYFSRGIIKINANRIFDENDGQILDGNKQLKTLQDFINSIKGINFEEWDSNKVYTPNKCVSYHGSTFRCIKTTYNHELPTNIEYWEVMTAGFNNCGEYLNGKKYDLRDIVIYTPLRGIYVCILPTDGTQSPTNATYWKEIISIKEEVDLAIEKANFANEQGMYAKTQGDYALEKGSYANEKAILAQEKANYAKQQGDYAKEKTDYAIEEVYKAKYSIDNVDNFYNNLQSIFIAHDAGIIITHNLNKYPLPNAVAMSSGYGDSGYGNFGYGDNCVYQIGCRAEYIDMNTIRLYLDETFEGTPTVTQINNNEYQVDFDADDSIKVFLF